MKDERIGPLRRIIFGLFVILCVSWTFARPAQKHTDVDNLPPIEIKEGWEYRWGDSPIDEGGIPTWIYLDQESPGWKPAPSPVNLPVEGKGNILWLRVFLPKDGRKESTLYIPRVFLNFEAYLNGERIYSFGEFRPRYKNRFSAFVPHRILLPENYQGKFIYFRVFSDLPRINGIQGGVFLGTGEKLTLHLIKQDILQFLVGVFCVFIGLLALVSFIDRSTGRPHAALSFGLFSFFIGMGFLAMLSHMFWFVPAPRFWYFVLFPSFFLFPAALLAFVEHVIGPGYKNFFRRLWQFHLLLVLFVIILEIADIRSMAAWMDSLQFLWIFDSLVVVAAGAYASTKGRYEARVFTVGIVFFSLFALRDIFSQGSTIMLMPLGTLIFIILLGYILYHRFTENSRKLRIYTKELEEKSEKLEDAGIQLEDYSHTLEQKVEERTREVKEKQAQLVQSSKMAALGSLVAGVAHEINTPVGAINSMHNTLMRAVEKVRGDIEDCFAETRAERKNIRSSLELIDDANKVIQSGTERVIEIVKRLRSFARLDEAELKDADINEGIEDTLTIIHHQIKHDITVIKNYGDIPKISCYPGRLNQVFLNLLINAKQSIDGKGTITISTYTRNNKVYVEFKDTGKGIAREELGKIFDPGFTTKGVGVGTGLGLSICYQIIQDHHGEILVESEVGKGTIFTVILPRDLEKELKSD
jgi:signal transduction histidine kinase